MAGVLLLSGCASDRRSDALARTMIAYANAVRWDGFERAAMFVDPSLREAHPLTNRDREHFKQVQINDYDDGNGPVPAGANQVRQTVRIGLTDVHTQTVRTLVDRQVWRYDPDRHTWWLETGIPDLNW
jgi:hypothetical protein